MKVYTEEQMRRAIRFGFESSSLLDEGDNFIDTEDFIELKPIGSRYDHRKVRDVIIYEGVQK
jgi:hypothetical protein